VNEVFCYCGPQIFELCYILEGLISYVYDVPLPCNLLTRHEHKLSFLHIHKTPHLLTTVTVPVRVLSQYLHLTHNARQVISTRVAYAAQLNHSYTRGKEQRREMFTKF
jgi:hypothetical protein